MPCAGRLADGRLRMLEAHEYERALLTRSDAAGSIGGHHAREARRLGRRLSEALDGPLEVTDHAGDPDAVERFLELELSGWKGRAGTAMGSTPGRAEFFRRVCAPPSPPPGGCELLDLGTGTRSAAMKCNLIAPPGSFGFKIAFDDALARFSPGIQLELAQIERVRGR